MPRGRYCRGLSQRRLSQYVSLHSSRDILLLPERLHHTIDVAVLIDRVQVKQVPVRFQFLVRVAIGLGKSPEALKVPGTPIWLAFAGLDDK